MFFLVKIKIGSFTYNQKFYDRDEAIAYVEKYPKFLVMYVIPGY